MEKTLFLYLLIITLTPRHLQVGEKAYAKLSFKPRRLNFIKHNETLHCRARLKNLDIYKSYYCFSKIKKKEGLNKPSWVLTSAKKNRKTKHANNNNEAVIYSSMFNWKDYYFLRLEKGT